MVIDGTSFIKRAQAFFLDLKANRYPNATTLAGKCGCSNNTAQRIIYRLRDEYLVPLEYDSSEKGYYLKDKTFTLPSFLPAGRDELIALLLAREFVGTLEATDLQLNLDSLWSQFATTNSSISRDLEPLTKVFSCESTVVGDMADRGLLEYISAAQAGESVTIHYKSPWRHTEEHCYTGRILRVHFSDGNLYLKFAEKSGREMILNASFVKDFVILPESVPIATLTTTKGSENWLDGFGVWAGKDLETITVEILPPAAEYFAKQRWHEEQEDRFDGEVLIRTFPGIVSPEISRRILSIGRFIRKVSPKSLADSVIEDAFHLMANLKKEGALPKVT